MGDLDSFGYGTFEVTPRERDYTVGSYMIPLDTSSVEEPRIELDLWKYGLGTRPQHSAIGKKIATSKSDAGELSGLLERGFAVEIVMPQKGQI